MNGYIKNIGVVLLLIVNRTGENLTTLKELLKSFHTKVKSSGLYLISVMVLAQLFHMLALIMYWIFNRSANLLGLHQLEQSKPHHIYYNNHKEDEEILGI